MAADHHPRATRARLEPATVLGPIMILACWLLLPADLYAQATIAGTVRDTSGAIMPGVTVEATSPALIEKVRSATTDSAGLYRIENLRPGEYTVTFTLPGFATVRREGLELNAFTTVTVNADLTVGGVEETITVVGETPVVDIQSAQRQTVLTGEVISAIPTAGSYNALLVLVPAIFGGQQDVKLAGFGLAPALVMYHWSLSALKFDGGTMGRVGWAVAFLYAACAALRLARFNTQVGIVDKRWFVGLASPAAAGLMMSFVWAFADVMNGLMAFPNLIGLVGLAGVVVSETRDYEQRYRTGHPRG